jgi:putative MFS transporter
VSFFNRLGGLTGPLLISLIVSSVTDVLVAVAVLALICGTIAWYTGRRHHRVTTSLSPAERTSERAG